MCFWLLMILLFASLIASAPVYPYSRRWGYGPTGGIGVFLLILLLLWWFAWLPWWGSYPYWWGR
jgi:hypothetical protein